MIPISPAVVELRLVAQRAEENAALASCLEDHRTEVVGDLVDALDRIDTGLGTRLLLAMYPWADVETLGRDGQLAHGGTAA